MNQSFSRADAGTLFLMLWIIVSVWSGFTIGLIFPLIILVCAGGVYAAIQKGWLAKKQSSTFPDASILLVGGVFLALLGLLLWQGGYDRSADVAASFAASLINEKIPSTYLPFFDLPFFYPPGLPSVVSQLAGVGLSTHVWGWVFGSLGLAMMVFYSARWARLVGVLHGQYLIPVFVVGLRFPLMSLLTGEYAVLLGYGVAMAAVWMGREKKEWFVVGAVAATLLHPYAGVLAWVGGLIILPWNIRQIVGGTAATFVGVAPIISQQLLPIFQRSQDAGLIFVPEVLNPLTVFSVAGIVPVFFGVIGILWYLFQRKNNPKMGWRLSALTGVGLVGVFIAYVFPTTVFGGKIILFLGLGLALFAGVFFSLVKLPFSEKKISAIILIVVLSVLLLSNNMVALANGSKISLNEANYATWLAENYDVRETKVLFLSSGHSKMAQYANTIPYDALSAHFLTSVTYNVFSNAETIRIQEEARAYKELFSSRCAACAEKMDADYIVVNTREFPLLTLPILNENNGFVLYSSSK